MRTESLAGPEQLVDLDGKKQVRTESVTGSEQLVDFATEFLHGQDEKVDKWTFFEDSIYLERTDLEVSFIQI